MGEADEAYRCFSMLNPVNHALDSGSAEVYRVEPYVVSADIYAGEGKGGRGGWTWYTGSAGWLYRAAVEGILGLERRGKRISVNPRIPSHWDGYTARLKIAGAEHTLRIVRAKGIKSMSIEVNGAKIKSSTFELKEGKASEVTVRLPG